MFGDSYIEAQMNDYGDTLPGALNDYLKTRREVLNFGMAGAEMPDYLGIAPLVRRDSRREWAVFVITAGDFTRGFLPRRAISNGSLANRRPIRLVPEIHRSD